MLTVEADAARVEKKLVSGKIFCPGCGGELRPWGWAVRRVLRGEDGVPTQVVRILRARLGWSPHERTLQRHFARLGIVQAHSSAPREVFGRFEALRPNELWVGDALHGPDAAGRKTYLFAFLDDHSRAVTGHRFGFAEDTVRLAAALHPALSSRGIPQGIYVDYADVRVMPTPARNRWPAGVGAVRTSA